MDCTKMILGASCQRDREFARVLELLLRVRESFVDAHGCYPDSSAPLELVGSRSPIDQTPFARDRQTECSAFPLAAKNLEVDDSQLFFS